MKVLTMAKENKNSWKLVNIVIKDRVVVTNPVIFNEGKAINQEGNLVTVTSFKSIAVKKALFDLSIQPKN